MRRVDRKLTEAESRDILQKGEFGTLSLVGSEGEPYGVPLSYVCIDESIYFHGSREGYKSECIANDKRASFCVVANAKAYYDGGFSARYASAVAYGDINEICDPDEKKAVLHSLCFKYLPAHAANAVDAIEKTVERTAVWRLTPERVTGKANKN